MFNMCLWFHNFSILSDLEVWQLTWLRNLQRGKPTKKGFFIVWMWSMDAMCEGDTPCLVTGFQNHFILLAFNRLHCWCCSTRDWLILLLYSVDFYTGYLLFCVVLQFGSVFSVYGLFRYNKMFTAYSLYGNEQQAIYAPLNPQDLESASNQQEGSCFLLSAEFWCYVFQIVFQMTAGAVMLTDFVYWIVIVPFLTLVDYPMNFLTVLAHSLNLVFLLGDTALNSLRFPWHRISYFIFLTAFYVIFEWVVHAFVNTWWPYPFLDLSMDLAPLWYLIVALLHLPCYAIFALVVELKYRILGRWFPESYRRLR